MSETTAVEQLESRSVPEIEKTPELSVEHKNQVLLVQRQILSLQVNLNNTQKQLDAVGPAFNNLLNKLAVEYKVDHDKYQFDIDSLTFVRKA